MQGIGQKPNSKLVTVSVECPTDLDGIMDQVRQILLLGQVQTIVLKEGEPITYQREMIPGEEIKLKDSTQGFAELTPFEVVRNVPMEEFSYKEFDLEKAKPHEKVLRAFLYMSSQEWLVSHLLLSPDTKFWKWLGLHKLLNRADRLPFLFNARIELDKTVPSDIFILCGAQTRHATIVEIACSLKVNIG